MGYVIPPKFDIMRHTDIILSPEISIEHPSAELATLTQLVGSPNGRVCSIECKKILIWAWHLMGVVLN